jgi:hypothetical protein
MRKITLALSLLLSTYAISSIEMERVKCQLINCAEMEGEELYRCRNHEKACHRRVFAKELEVWKEEGIERSLKADVLRGLESAQRQNTTVIKRLEDELEILKKESAEISEQIQTVRGLKERP